MIWTVVLVFIAAFVADAVWAQYTRFLTQERPLPAALLAAVLVVLGAVSIVAYAHALIYLIPSALGAASGTYVTVASHRASRRL